MKILKVIRRFERFNFYGVPERPEPMFQRNNSAQYSERLSGKSVTTHSTEQKYDDSTLIGYIKDDFENQEETFIRV